MAHDDKSKLKAKARPPRAPRFRRATRKPCPSLLTLLTSQKMTTNLAPYRRPPLLSHIAGALKPRGCPVFLIDARLKSRPTHSKLSPLKSPNRERMATHRRALSRLPSFEPPPASLQNPWPPYDGRLIANLNKIRLTARKTNHIQFSNRKFSALFALNSSVSTANACSSTQLVLIYGGAIKTPRNTFKICTIRISNRR